MLKPGKGFAARPVEAGDWTGAVVCAHVQGSVYCDGRELAQMTFDYGSDYMLLIACERCSTVLMFSDAQHHGRVLSEIPSMLDEVWQKLNAMRDIVRKATKGKVSSKEIGKVRALKTLVEEAEKIASTINIDEEDEDATEEPNGLGIRVIDKPYTHLSNEAYDALMQKVRGRQP